MQVDHGWSRSCAVLLAWVAGLLVLLPPPAAAWGHQGHAVVGALADQMLSARARTGLQRDLGLTLEQAAPWADCAKGVSLGTRGFEYVADPRWASPACTRFESADGMRAMQDYVARNWDSCGQRRDCHKTYHYTDVAFQHADYQRAYLGTNDHDLVQAINAAVAQLQGKPVPPPFSITSRREALLLLAHFVGDLHQPLHVGALYLDDASRPVNPDEPGALAGAVVFETRGGNSLLLGRNSNLHALWDEIPEQLRANALPPAMLVEARGLAGSRTKPARWAQIWAGESVAIASQAFAGLAFTAVPQETGGRLWTVAFDDEATYRARLLQVQTTQLTKAGARLARLVNAVYEPRR